MLLVVIIELTLQEAHPLLAAILALYSALEID